MNGKKICKDTVKRCIHIRTKKGSCKRRELNISQRKGTSTSRITGRGAEITVDLGARMSRKQSQRT